MTASLRALRILALDCQATGANPQKGRLLELGWMPACALSTENPQVSAAQAYLNLLPKDEKIPPSVSRITGISDNLMTAAETSNSIWQHLMVTVKRINSENLPCLLFIGNPNYFGLRIWDFGFWIEKK